MKATQKFLDEQRSPFTWKVQSKSELGKFHNVSFNEKTNKWECDCIAGQFKANCRHIRITKHKLNKKI